MRCETHHFDKEDSLMFVVPPAPDRGRLRLVDVVPCRIWCDADLLLHVHCNGIESKDPTSSNHHLLQKQMKIIIKLKKTRVTFVSSNNIYHTQLYVRI